MTEVPQEVRLIHWGTDQYRQALQLRNEFLRKPLGMNLFDEELSHEEHDTHIGAFRGQELLGTLILSAQGDHLKMRQVAVAEHARSSHVGTRMVQFAEHLACELGYRRIELHARQSAVDFYQRSGYCCIGEKFEEIGIVHLKMVKSLACP